MIPESKPFRLLHKLNYSAPSLTDVYPPFSEEYDEALHGKTLIKELNLSHLWTSQKKAVSNIINVFWHFSRKKDFIIPFKDYKYKIDMGYNLSIDFTKIPLLDHLKLLK